MVKWSQLFFFKKIFLEDVGYVVVLASLTRELAKVIWEAFAPISTFTRI